MKMYEYNISMEQFIKILKIEKEIKDQQDLKEFYLRKKWTSKLYLQFNCL